MRSSDFHEHRSAEPLAYPLQEELIVVMQLFPVQISFWFTMSDQITSVVFTVSAVGTCNETAI